ncbi:MAG: CBS domain-containing protein [Bradymonadaceae bacterium]|nr:CBS domain-containing protein [Lujinxingiaceae bacterium]
MNAGALCNRHVLTAFEDDSLVEAAHRMLESEVGALVVVRKSERGLPIPAGVVTDRDIVVGGLARRDGDLRPLRVKDIITHTVHVAHERTPLEDVLALMREHNVRRLPVVDDEGGLIGLVSLDELLDWIAEELNHAADAFDRAGHGKTGLDV